MITAFTTQVSGEPGPAHIELRPIVTALAGRNPIPAPKSDTAGVPVARLLGEAIDNAALHAELAAAV